MSSMVISRLCLSHFRLYISREFSFGPKTVVVWGRNGVGKTNILEAIYLLATGESFRAERIEEMVRWGETIGQVSGTLRDDRQQTTNVEVMLTRGEYMGKRIQKRRYKVNGVARRKVDFAGNLRAVVFRPEDVELVTGSPGTKRRFLDWTLMQVDREYRRSLVSYEKGLKRRNKVLSLIQEGNVDRRALLFWDQLLIKEGNVLTTKRQELIDALNRHQYFPVKLLLVYAPSTISESRLAQYAREEVAAGYTFVGPHRDDFRILTQPEFKKNNDAFGKVDLALYGSRGQQRLGVLWLKLAEREFIEEKTGEKPILLLDDIFSELDSVHDEMVLNLLGKQQTIITTTEIDGKFNEKDMEIIQL